MNHYRWRGADESDDFFCCPDAYSRKIVYARIYTIGQGYHSETNQLIFNLKKPISSSPAELRYKAQAIETFATELAHLLAGIPKKTFTLVPVPPSKTRNHAEFDDRLEQVARKACQKAPNIRFLPLIIGTQDRDAVHLDQKYPRRVDLILKTIAVDKAPLSQYEARSTLVILDDVSTSGASFEAVYRRLVEYFPSNDIVIIFWAKAKQPNPTQSESIRALNQKVGKT